MYIYCIIYRKIYVFVPIHMLDRARACSSMLVLQAYASMRMSAHARACSSMCMRYT